LKKVFVFFILVFTVISFSFNFGAGGSKIVYIPGNQIISPFTDTSFSIDDGVICFGGEGHGGIFNDFYMGGDGFTGKKDFTVSGTSLSFSFEYGTFDMGRNLINILDTVVLDAGVGIGTYSIKISRNLLGGDTIDDFLLGRSSGISSMKIDYYIASPYTSLYLHFVDFFAINVKARYILGYTESGWVYSNGNKVDVDESNYLNTYNIGVSILFGY